MKKNEIRNENLLWSQLKEEKETEVGELVRIRRALHRGAIER